MTLAKLKTGFRPRSKSVEHHKNYFLLERENVERKYETRAKEIQFEVLNAQTDIELQMREQKRQLDESILIMHQQLQHQQIKNHNRKHTQHCDKHRSNELQSQLKKRIRLRRLSTQGIQLHNDSSPVRTAVAAISNLNMTIADIQLKYRNKNASETDV